MENPESLQCGNALANGVAVCGACDKEINDDLQLQVTGRDAYHHTAPVLTMLSFF